ncbi:DUF429 domain-containing protein [Cumulibacter manganitolerans]|uniref:DUF429 domain-containing protein n=1 Tax=Cumulibacter manganitolerans TaxID=1884992 RepID=UPI0012960739|nr:DUF429 domain-containing protein [Cumulibacter manganitolerans]
MGAYVGIDLAWKDSNRTGLAAVDGFGALTASGVARADSEIAGWLEEHAPAPMVVAVDAPLIVPNAAGQRVAEKLIGQAYSRYGAAAYPANRGNPLFNPPRAETLAQRFGWEIDPATPVGNGRTVCLEVYPHPALVGLFALPQRVLYKKGTARQAGFQQLAELLASISELRLEESRRWAELVATIAHPARGDLTRIEDELDAILCAHLAWLWHHRPEALTVYGTVQDGYIVAPPKPAHAWERCPAPRGRVDPHDTAGPVVTYSRSVTGRADLGLGHTDWQNRVHRAFGDCSIPGRGPVSVDVEFVMDETAAQPAIALHSLVAATIDALDDVLGARDEDRRVAAHATRVARLSASKRAARDGTQEGAVITVTDGGDGS